MKMTSLIKLVAFSILMLSTKTTFSQIEPALYKLKLKNIDGETVSLSTYKDNVLVIVNTASKCGFTPQYKDLESLQEKYKDQKVKVLGFPSNDFGNTEPADNGEIKKFCKLKYGVTFPVFEKSSVNGELGPINPLFKILTQESEEALRGKVSWNFEKFIVDKKGNLRERFGPSTNPASTKVTDSIEKLLDE